MIFSPTYKQFIFHHFRLSPIKNILCVFIRQWLIFFFYLYQIGNATFFGFHWRACGSRFRKLIQFLISIHYIFYISSYVVQISKSALWYSSSNDLSHISNQVTWRMFMYREKNWECLFDKSIVGIFLSKRIVMTNFIFCWNFFLKNFVFISVCIYLKIIGVVDVAPMESTVLGLVHARGFFQRRWGPYVSFLELRIQIFFEDSLLGSVQWCIVRESKVAAFAFFFVTVVTTFSISVFSSQPHLLVYSLCNWCKRVRGPKDHSCPLPLWGLIHLWTYNHRCVYSQRWNISNYRTCHKLPLPRRWTFPHTPWGFLSFLEW